MNIVQFRYHGQFLCQNAINWPFKVGDVFEFWGGQNRVESVRTVLMNSYDGLEVHQVVEIEPVDYDLSEFKKIEK